MVLFEPALTTVIVHRSVCEGRRAEGQGRQGQGRQGGQGQRQGQAPSSPHLSPVPHLPHLVPAHKPQ